MKKFSEYLEKFGIDCKLVIDVETCNGFPSKNITQWINPLKKFNLLVESFKPDAVFVDRQTQFQNWCNQSRNSTFNAVKR